MDGNAPTAGSIVPAGVINGRDSEQQQPTSDTTAPSMLDRLAEQVAAYRQALISAEIDGGAGS